MTGSMAIFYKLSKNPMFSIKYYPRATQTRRNAGSSCSDLRTWHFPPASCPQKLNGSIFHIPSIFGIVSKTHGLFPIAKARRDETRRFLPLFSVRPIWKVVRARNGVISLSLSTRCLLCCGHRNFLSVWRKTGKLPFIAMGSLLRDTVDMCPKYVSYRQQSEPAFNSDTFSIYSFRKIEPGVSVYIIRLGKPCECMNCIFINVTHQARREASMPFICFQFGCRRSKCLHICTQRC